ncbi:MAG: hypothetical protein ABF326_01160 [Arenicellales bacterium]
MNDRGLRTEALVDKYVNRKRPLLLDCGESRGAGKLNSRGTYCRKQSMTVEFKKALLQ